MTSPIHDRLDFLQIDQKTKDDVKRLKPVVAAQMPVALARFYEHIKRYPETRKFFSSETMMKSARDRQISHWDIIVEGEFGDDYYRRVSTVGQTHARIGLEPRWYIGGYAFIAARRAERVSLDFRRGAQRYTVQVQLLRGDSDLGG